MELDNFQMNVIYVVAALSLVLLIVIGYLIYKKNKSAAKDMIKSINCPDYWEDVSDGNGSNCVNVKNLGTCGSNSMDFTTKQWVGDKGLCNKNEWAKKCDLTWDGITNNPNIKRVVGDSLSGSAALELQKHHPALKVRTYGAPVVDLEGAVQPSRNTDTERYRILGDPISLFDSSTHTTCYPKFNDQQVLTQQYQNNANNI